MSKRERSAAEQRRDDLYAAVRKVCGLIDLYDELAASLAAEPSDVELVRRMLATRDTVLLLIEAAMPLPLRTAELDEVLTKSRAVH